MSRTLSENEVSVHLESRVVPPRTGSLQTDGFLYVRSFHEGGRVGRVADNVV